MDQRPAISVLPSVWNVPYAQNPHFSGRESFIADLHHKLTSGSAGPCVVHGPAGLGKTQVAVEYAHAHAAEYKAVWWLHADDPASVARGYAALAERLELRGPGGAVVGASRQALWRALDERGPWLLIFDNANRA